MPAVTVTRTYLQMESPGELRAAPAPDPSVRVERVEACPPSFFRYLYAEVGRAYHWTDRLGWSEREVAEHLADRAVSVWLMTCRGAPAGYFELRRHEDDSVEIAYFGLLPEFTGRGLGKHLLTEAARAAWACAPRRVWLHTCTLDHPAALPNYVARGFKPYREEVYLASVPAPLDSSA